MNRILALALVGFAAVQAAHNIVDFGANSTEVECDTPSAFANTNAFLQAVQAANTSDVDRVVLIPKLPQN